MNRASLVAVVTLILTFGSPTSSAQVTTGTPPFGNFTGGPDVINLSNLNVVLSVPIINKAGRGLPFSYALSYNSSVWFPLNSGGTSSWQPVTTNPNYNYWGWQGLEPAGEPYITYAMEPVVEHCVNRDNINEQYTLYNYSNFQYVDPKGSGHTFTYNPSYTEVGYPGGGACPVSGAQPSSPQPVASKDGSGYTLSATPYPGYALAYVVTRDGTTIHAALPNTQGWWEVDRNGNEMTSNNGSYTDTLGDAVLSVAGTPPTNTTFTYAGPSGNVSYTAKYTSYTVRTNFGCADIAEFGPSSENLVSEIDLPDSSKYTFSYEPTPGYSGDVTGRIASVTFPTGGKITYAYEVNGNNEWDGIECSDGSTALLTRTVTPGGSEPAGSWTYIHSESGSSSSTEVHDPAGNELLLSFQDGYEAERQVFNPSSSMLETVYTCYNGAQLPKGGSACFGTITLPITERTVYTELPLGSGTLESENDFFNNGYGSPKEDDDYGYGSGAVGSLLRKTLIQYASLGNNLLDLPASIQVENGSGAIVSQTNYSYDQTSVVPTSGTPEHATISGSRGNATTVSSLVTGSSTYLTKTYTYFDTGNVDVATDVNGAQTTDTYGACGNSFPTQIALPLGLNESQTWNCNGGVVTSIIDANNQTTTNTYNDLYYWRPAQVFNADGGWQAFSYPSLAETDTHIGITNPTPSTSCSTGCRYNQALLDGLGRAEENLLVSDADGETTVTTTYDPANAQVDVTNPDRSGATTNGTTKTSYDTLGRTTGATQPDGGVAHTYYGSDVSGNGGILAQLCSTSTYGYGFPALSIDAAGTKREVWTDGLGRTIEADEPDSSNNLIKGTCYLHDANGNLIQSVAPTNQTRTYAYDDLGRATSATVPETNNVATTFLYDTADGSCSNYGSSGDLVEQKDAAGKLICYQYDQLHRRTSVSYSDGTHAVNYYYDQSSYNGLTISNGKGRRTGMSDGSGETAWSYDPVGRIVTEEKTIGTVTKTLGYTYNYDGSLASMTYPDGRVVNYAYNNAQRPVSAIDPSGPINYATGATYWPQGVLNMALHGQVSGGFNGIMETWNYNDDLEPTSVTASSSVGTALSLTYSYALPGGNNGTVASINNGNNANRNETMTYDPLLRLLSAQTAGTSGQDCWGLNFGSGGLADDPLGNLTSISVSKCSGPSLSVSVNGNNQITNTGFSYDADGDATADGQYSYSYNAENEITSGNGVNYTYDGDDLRVEKSSGTLYWRSYTGEVLEETNTSGSMQRDYIFFAGRRVAWRDSSGNVYYYFADAQGSTRTVTNATGTTCFNADYYPYGQENDYNTSCSPTYKFTGYEYDSETGNYYAYARYYSPRLGRFMTTDPLGGDASNPQSQNRYTYVVNNPESMVDPRGMYPYTGRPPTAPPPVDPRIWCAFWVDYTWTDTGLGWVLTNVQVGDMLPGSCYSVSGGGGGGGCIIGSCAPVNLPIPPPSKDCVGAISSANRDPKAYNRAEQYWGILANPDLNGGQDPALLAAVGIYESSFNPSALEPRDEGCGGGAFQLDICRNNDIPMTAPFSVTLSVPFAANILYEGFNYYMKRGFNYIDSEVGAIRWYNAGRKGGISAIANGTPDQGTRGNDYVTNVLAIAKNCFGFQL